MNQRRVIKTWGPLEPATFDKNNIKKYQFQVLKVPSEKSEKKQAENYYHMKTDGVK